ncbi:ABC transporter permease [Kitasatospora sp. NBC_01539]|uniref:ABC transporter permease n=1 Tax=Kitasatospora sp. NBC_01539 TaxID=2903577 RepID=UPI00386010BE
MADAAPPADPGHPHPGRPDPTPPDDRLSVFRAPVVLVVLLAAAAALFAGSYCVAMANPTPHRLPVAVVGSSPRGPQLVDELEKRLDSALQVHVYPDDASAGQAVDEQRVFAVLRLRERSAVLGLVPAAGASTARVLAVAGPPAGQAAGLPVAVTDIRPLQSTDPQGLAVFYISLAAVIIGFVGAVQLSVHARALDPPERIAFTAAYAVLGGFAVAATVDWGLGVLDLPFAESWGILTLTMCTTGMVFTMFNTLIGRWAILPTWGLMVLLGNPSSGGAVSWPLLPQPLGLIGRWLPPGASVNAQHTAIYFRQDQYAFPYLVLLGWLALSTAVFWLWQDRHPGGRSAAAAATGTAPAGT